MSLLAAIEPKGAASDRIFPGLTTRRLQREMREALARADVSQAEERILYDLRHSYTSVGISKLRMDAATLADRLGHGVDVCLKHYAAWWEDLSPLGSAVFSDSFDGGVGRGQVGDGSAPAEELPWELPANEERTTGVEPATFGLGSRRSTS